MKRVLIVRSDNNGDVLLAEPAIRSVAMSTDVDLLVGPRGVGAAGLIESVREVLTHRLPWIDPDITEVNGDALDRLTDEIKQRRYDEALILTSFHQSPLPLALLLRLAGVPRIVARSEDYPGGLLDVRVQGDPDVHEVERSLQIVEAAGYARCQDLRLRIKQVPQSTHRPTSPYIVLNPGGSAPARRWPLVHWQQLARTLAEEYVLVAVGSEDERELTHSLEGVVDLVGLTSFEDLADLIGHATAVITGNTAAVHLAAATGTPVIELFAPVVPLGRWAPWRVSHRVLSRVESLCAGKRWRQCQIEGHPCMSDISPEEVSMSLRSLLLEAS